MTSPASPFDDHVIVHSIIDHVVGFGTWLCQRPSARANPDGYTRVFWFRVVADRGLLTVTGDFYPTSFELGPSNPEQCVHWMGSRAPSDSYFLQKARRGSGKASIVSHDVDDAIADLKELLSTAEEDDDHDHEWWRSALMSAIEHPYQYEGELGVHELRMVVLDAPEVDVAEVGELLEGMGQRPADHVVLAAQALRKLSQLLQATEVESASDSADASITP